MSDLYNEIKSYILSLGFVPEGEPDTCFRMKLQIPGRRLVINGKCVNEPDRTENFDIISLGEGAELDVNDVPIGELHGFKIANNDFWVNSLEDFKFWIEKIFQAIKS